ncbi:MAG: glycosyltransferase family 2 protein [Planctomycetota bacterium]
MSQGPTYSFIFPVMNEEDVIGELHRQLLPFLEELDGPAEVILIDDGSTDASLERMKEIAERDDRFVVLEFSRNFGHQIAITAGMDRARGEAIIIMDADLQDPLSVVHQMIEKWREGYEVVYGKRLRREGDTWFKKATASAFYKLLERLTDTPIPRDVGDFRLVDRAALDAFLRMRERNRFIRGMFAWIGFRTTSVEFYREARFAGETGYPLRKMIRFAANGIISFSDAPLRLALNFGFLTALFSIAMAVWFIAQKLLGYSVEPGWASLAVLITFFGGVISMLLGVLGMYVARIYDEIKARPLYFVRAVHGAPEPSAE